MIPRINGFEIRRLIGEGGTGLVYEARQLSPGRDVALKILRPEVVDAEHLRRFRREAEVLGWLNHECIAEVYRAGTEETSDGTQPFLCMELVRGEPIDAYVRARDLSTRERVQLVLHLCDAVQHAHQKGVIHRDLKPANILVTKEGRPKVLDFGIARLTNADQELTSAGALLGTLPYMSPEQVGADPARVDTQSDVYAVGAIAYELLAGEAPLDLTGLPLAEAARRIEEEEPVPLGRRDASLRGDLEVVVGKALAKDRPRRYASIEELAADLRRTLANEPITARSPSRRYQLAKFTRRNRGLVAGLTLAFLALVAGTATSTTLYLQTSSLLAATEDEAATAKEVLGFLEGVFAQSDPLREEMSVAEVARLAAQRLRGEFHERPAVRARLLGVLGLTLKRLELGAEAVDLLEEARQLNSDLHGADSPEVARVLEHLGGARMAESRVTEAEELYRRAVTIRRAASTTGPELADALRYQGSALMSLARYPEAKLLQEEALALSLASRGADHPRTLAIQLAIAVRLYNEDELVESEELLSTILATEGADLELLRITALNRLANTLRGQLRFREALPHLREAVAIAEERFGPVARLTRDVKVTLAAHLANLGAFEEPIAIMRAIYADVLRRFGPDSPLAAETLNMLAFALHESPDKEEAEDLYLEAIERLTASHGPDDWIVFEAEHNLGILYLDQGRLEEAEGMLREAFEGRERTRGAGNLQTLSSARNLSVILFRARRFEEAVELRREILALTAPSQGEGSALTQDARIDLANGLRKLSEFEEAEELLRAAHAALPGMATEERTTRRVREGFRELYRSWGRADEQHRWRD